MGSGLYLTHQKSHTPQDHLASYQHFTSIALLLFILHRAARLWINQQKQGLMPWKCCGKAHHHAKTRVLGHPQSATFGFIVAMLAPAYSKPNRDTPTTTTMLVVVVVLLGSTGTTGSCGRAASPC